MRSRLRAVPCIAILTALTHASCAGIQRGVVGALADLDAERIEELATFKCVTEETAALVTKSFDPGDARFLRGAELYNGTRDAFNPVVEALANDVERGRAIDVDGYWTRFSVAREHQSRLSAFAEDQSEAFGFVSLSMLASAAAPYAQRIARDFLERHLRAYAANHLRTHLLLQPHDEAGAGCTDYNPSTQGS